MAIGQKRGKRKIASQYASPLRRVRRHKRKAINMSSSTSSSGKRFLSCIIIKVNVKLLLM